MAGLGGKNWTFEEEVTSSDVNGYLADQVVMRFADEATRTAGFGGAGEPTLAEGMVSYLDDANRVDFYNGSAWKPMSPFSLIQSASVATSQTTTSTSYTDLSTVGPSVTLTTGTLCLVILTAQMTAGNQNVYASFAVSGATTTAASDDRSFSFNTVGANNQLIFASRVLLETVTAGSNTFTMKYRASTSTTATFANRNIIVIPL